MDQVSSHSSFESEYKQSSQASKTSKIRLAPAVLGHPAKNVGINLAGGGTQLVESFKSALSSGPISPVAGKEGETATDEIMEVI
jgi:hypothetical protein